MPLLALAGSLRATEPAIKLPRFLVEESNASAGPTSIVLNSDDPRNRAAITLGDAISRAPGLFLQESFGGFEPPRLSFRGSGMQSAPSSRGLTLAIDGLPLNLADGSFNSACFSPQIASRIEVSRGFDAWSSSNATMGGIINLDTRKTPHGALRADVGSFGALHADASTVVFGSPVLALKAAYEQQTGYRDHCDQQRKLVFGSVSYQTPGEGGTSISAFWIRPEYNVPGPLTLAAAQSAPRSVSSDVTRDQPRREAELIRTAITTRGKVSLFHYDAGAAVQHCTDWFRQLQANGISDSKSDDASLHASLSAPFEIAGLQDQLHAETNAIRGWRSLTRFTNNAGQTGNRFGRDGLHATTATFALEDTIKLFPTVTATAGYTRVYASRDIVDHQPTTPSTTYSQNQTSNLAAFGLQWTPSADQTVFARLYQSDEPATFDDLLFVAGTYPNLTRRSQSLLSQHATTSEFGTRGQFGKLNWTATAYRSVWHNEILRLTDANGSPRGSVNASPTLHAGVETSLRWRVLDQGQRLTLSTQCNWGRYTFEHDPVYGTNRLAGIPLCLGSAELLYEHPRGFFSGASLNWTAAQTPVDHAGRMSYGGHTRADLRGGWDSGKGWSIYAEIRNLLDRQYIASTAGVLDLARNAANTAIFLPGNGRSIMVGFEWRP